MYKKIKIIMICMLIVFAVILPATGEKSTNENMGNIGNDSFYSDALIPTDILNIKTTPKLTPGPGFYETSEYMIGSVAVGVIFLESDGTGSDPNQENWNPTTEGNVQSEIQQSLNWWISQNTNAGISVVYDWQFGVPTQYEPIRHPSVFTDPSWETLWVNEAMAYLGYTSGDKFARTRSYNNDLRTNKGTDWVFTVFIVDSNVDSDGWFSDGFGYCAWAYTGGPFLVMTYDNGKVSSGGWGIGRMDQVMAHETGHMFWATDEYMIPGEWSGYLNQQETDNSGCIMDTNTLCVSPGTQLQIGWRDTDVDGIHDIIDTNPDTTLNPYSPNPTTDTILTYNGSATVVPYPNNNPQPWASGNDVTINTISKVYYRVDSGSWIVATPTDGLYDSYQESFTFTTSSLSVGQHVIEAQAMNSVMNLDPTPSSDIITIIQNNPPNIPSNPNPANNSVDVSIETDLSWTGGDPDPGDTVIYDVYFGTNSNPPNVATGQSSTAYILSTLNYNTKYYWRIDAWDNYGYSTSGPTWTFTTGSNSPPFKPSNPNPANNSINININTDLSWTGGDPDDDTVTYDVYFGTNSNPPNVATGQSSETYDPGTLNTGTKYYWRVDAWDSNGYSATGNVWNFQTQGSSENDPPNTPDIDGPTSGKTGTEYDFTIETTDPENDDVYYYIEWGDGTVEEWIGSYNSGEQIIRSHTWNDKDTFTIRVKAKDTEGAESNWATLEISIPKNKLYNAWFFWFFEKFFDRFPLLEQLLGFF
jgi:hypothetical protein